jgi:hypothetical protein
VKRRAPRAVRGRPLGRRSLLAGRRVLGVALLWALACKPDLGPSDGLVTAPRILAVKADPPEGKPGTPATYTAVLAAPNGTSPPGEVVLRFCTAPKALTDDNVVSSLCLDPSGLVLAGTGPAVVAATPGGACALFGPETPAIGGSARPRDPDVTGGYYQPLRVDWAGADPTFYLARIRCDLADAPADVAAEYAQQYVPNANPHLLPLGITVDGADASLSAIPAGARVELEAGWPATDAETYAYFDPGSQTLSTKREAMRVSWYTSDGAFDTESTGRDETDPATTTRNAWAAPTKARQARLWVVLRDSRGGVDTATYDVTVGP